MALKINQANGIATQINDRFGHKQLNAAVKGTDNEVVALAESISFNVQELMELAEIFDGQKITFSRSGAKVRMAIS